MYKDIQLARIHIKCQQINTIVPLLDFHWVIQVVFVHNFPSDLNSCGAGHEKRSGPVSANRCCCNAARDYLTVSDLYW